MKKIIIITIFIGLLFGFWQTAQALLVDYPDIPGVTKPGEAKPGEELPQIIRYIYMFSLGAVGIVALLSILIGAFQYVTSAGNPTKMGEAKDRIFSALLGVLLLLASVLILNTINPELVKLGMPTKELSIPEKSKSSEEDIKMGYACWCCSSLLKCDPLKGKRLFCSTEFTKEKAWEACEFQCKSEGLKYVLGYWYLPRYESCKETVKIDCVCEDQDNPKNTFSAGCYEFASSQKCKDTCGPICDKAPGNYKLLCKQNSPNCK